MASYWIVVTRENAELYELLSVAFRGRPDFSVIIDRRAAGQAAGKAERRGRGPRLGPDEFVVAERLDPVGQPFDASAAGNRRVKVSVPVRRRRVPPGSRRTSSLGSGGGPARSRTPLATLR